MPPKKSKKAAASADVAVVEAVEPDAPKKKKARKTPTGPALVIVESPAKARTIGKFLGRDFEVRASMGHVRDLPKKGMGIKVEKKGGKTFFRATYEVIPDKGLVKVIVTIFGRPTPVELEYWQVESI